jgi:TfoX/Sxy family transcriptional regulator of competence genes
MPFDPGIAARLEEIKQRDFGHISGLEETRMFGGFGYLLNGNMCVGIHKDTLILRGGVDGAARLLEEDHVRPMDLTGKIMKGWVTVESEAMEEDSDISRFCSHAITFVNELPSKC